MDSEESEGTRVCGQCKKRVAEANFALHESHCGRFLRVCPDCEEAVPKELLEQHRVEQHSQVKCSQCSRRVERCRLTEHQSAECESRLQSCEFCELVVPWVGLTEHSSACGSRTERCPDCRRYVTLRARRDHALICPARICPARICPAQPGLATPTTKKQTPALCPSCLNTFPPDLIEEHQLSCRPSAEEEEEEGKEEEEKEEEEEEEEEEEPGSTLSSSLKAASLSERLGGAVGGDRDPDRISTCPHCHLALPLLTLRWHQVKCQIHVNLR